MDQTKLYDIVFAASQILQGDGVYFSFTELKMMAEALSETDHGLDPTTLAEFYELHA